MNVMNILSIGCSYNKSQNSLTMTVNDGRIRSKLREEIVEDDMTYDTLEEVAAAKTLMELWIRLSRLH